MPLFCSSNAVACSVGYPRQSTKESTKEMLCIDYAATSRRSLGAPSFRLNDAGSLLVIVAACPAFCSEIVRSFSFSGEKIWTLNDSRNSTQSSSLQRAPSSTPPTAAKRFCGHRWSSSAFIATNAHARMRRCIVRKVSGTTLSMTQSRRM